MISTKWKSLGILCSSSYDMIWASADWGSWKCAAWARHWNLLVPMTFLIIEPRHCFNKNLLKLSWDKNILELDIVILQTIGIVIWSGGFTHTCVLITRKQKGPLVGFQLTPSDLPTHPRNPMMDRQTWLVTHTAKQSHTIYIYIRTIVYMYTTKQYIYMHIHIHIHYIYIYNIIPIIINL